MTAPRLIFEPSVYVLSRPALDRAELARFLTDTGFPDWATDAPCDAQAVVEVGARICYRSFARGRPHREHVAHLAEAGHFSTYEHANWTLLITGVSRTLSHELVRHRHCSPSQESQRYVDASDVAFVVPPALEAAGRAWAADREEQLDTPFDKWVEHNQTAVSRYAALCDHLAEVPVKQRREAARSVLPGCCETRLTLTANARAWREMLGKRLGVGVDAEFRRLAGVIRGRLTAEAPDLFAGV